MGISCPSYDNKAKKYTQIDNYCKQCFQVNQTKKKIKRERIKSLRIRRASCTKYLQTNNKSFIFVTVVRVFGVEPIETDLTTCVPLPWDVPGIDKFNIAVAPL